MISEPLMRLILLEQYLIEEVVSKCFMLTAGFKIKEGENFNHRNTLSISRIYPPQAGYNLSLASRRWREAKGDVLKLALKVNDATKRY